ncbi:MAG: hypothetical protein LBS84_00095 [Clostridiales bacterium]|jgi:chemotaxis protein MotA|nr:hypothetical protein [Clostridiales bacterium]
MRNAISAGRIKRDAMLLSRLAADVRSSRQVSMEEAAKTVTEPFLREALLMASGGIDAESLRETLGLKMGVIREGFEEAERFWRFFASICSAWGMIGALAGLALIVFENEYGLDGFSLAVSSAGLSVFISQCLAIPIAFRIKSKAGRELRRLRMITEVLVSVKSGDTPCVSGEKIKIYSGWDGGLIE